MFPSEQEKLPVPEVQVPWDVVVAPRVKPLGHESVRLTPTACDGPAFVTVITYVWFSPTITVVTKSFLVTVRSAVLLTTVSVSLAVLLVGLGSVVSVVTLTVLVCVPADVVAGTVKLAVTMTEAPEAIFPSEQVK